MAENLERRTEKFRCDNSDCEIADFEITIFASAKKCGEFSRGEIVISCPICGSQMITSFPRAR